MSPAPEIPAPTGGAGADQTALERVRANPVVLEMEVPPLVPTPSEQGSRPEVSEVPPSSAELVVSWAMMTRASAHMRPARAASALRLASVEAASL